MRQTGIECIGAVPWGTHFCQFYQDRQDLLDILVPYFKAGLEQNEFCMWVTSEPLRAAEARAALALAMPNLDNYVRAGQIEILDGHQWYSLNGQYEAERVLRGWEEKLDAARHGGFEGLRLTGNAFWLEQSNWQDFTPYAAAVNRVVGPRRMLAICTYSLRKCGAAEIMEVMSNHAFALVRRDGRWERIENANRKHLEEELVRLASFPERNPNPIAEADLAGHIHYLNPAARTLLPDLEERGSGHPWLADWQAIVGEFLPGGAVVRVREVAVGERCFEQVIHYEADSGRLRIYSADVTERKRAEDAIRDSQSQLEARVRERTAELGRTIATLQDEVARRVLADRALHDASRYARSLIEASLDPLVTISPEGKITDVNAATEEATGRSRAQLIGSDFSDYFTEPALARQGYETVLAQGLVRNYPLTIRHVSGRTTAVTYNATVYRNEAGEVQGVFAAARDMTEHVRAEEAAQRLAAIVESTSDPVMSKRLDGTIVTWNEAAAAIFGYTAHEILGRNVAVLAPPERANEVAEILERIRRGERIASYETERVAKDGTKKHVALTISPLRDAAGAVVGASTIARDITERRQMEQERRAASLYARALIEASLDPLVTISPDGKVTDVNQATEEATGLPRERLIGTDFSSYFTEPHLADEGYRKVLSAGFVRDYPLTIRHASGRTIDVLYNATVYRNEAGEVQGVFAAARDITERKRTEAELDLYRQRLEELVRQRTAELEQAVAELGRSNKDLEQFAYVASHDLQEPLRMVAGFVELLRAEHHDRLGPDADTYITYAVDGARRMQSLIDDLLAYSRVSTRAEDFNLIDSGEALDEALARLYAAVQEAGAAVTHGALPRVKADAMQLAQLFQNLIGNAVKFRGQAPPRVHVEARREGEDWLFSVTDNGIGLDPAFKDRIFLIFQRLHNRTQYPGTGMGLAICKRIVERHGGRIWVESEPGHGATFFFTLPAWRSQHGR